MADEADPTTDVDPPSAEAEPAAEVSGGGDAPSTLTREDLAENRTWGTDRIGFAVLAAAALVMIGFVLGRTSAPDGASSSDTVVTVPAASAFPLGDQDRSGYWEFAGITAVLTDDFAREDGPLGSNADGDEWNVASGSWGIEDERAVVTDSRAQPSVAVLPGGGVNRLTEATLTTVQTGAGIVFRYRDLGNYWSLTADPANAGWLLEAVVDGVSERVTSIPGATVDGTSIGVAQRGDELQLLVDGIEATRLTDARLDSQARSGLIAPPDAVDAATWDRFYVGDIAVTG